MLEYEIISVCITMSLTSFLINYQLLFHPLTDLNMYWYF